MKLNDIFDLIEYIASQHNTGDTMTPSQRNLLLEYVNQEFYNQEYEKYEVNRNISDNMRPFEVIMGGGSTMPLKVSSSGLATIPTDYMHGSSMYYKKVVGSSGLNPSITEKIIEELTDSEFSERVGSVLRTTTKYPVCTYRNGYIEFRPKDINYVEFTYLRKPTTPYYDYYISTSGEEIYLEAGEVHTWATGEVDSSGVTHTIGDPNYTSQTFELEFPENTHIAITRLILSKVGINLSDADIYVYSEQQQNKKGNE